MLKIPDIPKSRLILILGFLICLPAAFFVYQAWFNPQIEFLVPSLRSQWILHSPDELFPGRLSGTIVFRRRFKLSSVPKECKLQVRAASRFSIAVNGKPEEPDGRRPVRSWKFSHTFDVTPLLKISDNTIEIRVTNDNGLPALLVEASPLSGGELNLESDTNWESASGPDFSRWRRCVYTFQEPPVFGEDKSTVQKLPIRPYYLIFCFLYGLFVLVAVNPWRVLRRTSKPASDVHAPGRWILVFAALCLTLVFVIYVRNAISYPYSRSYFDADAHVAYVRYVAESWRVPVATQGWQMYQPPLYYFLSALVYKVAGGMANESISLKAVQFVGVFSGIACVLISWLVLRLCTKNRLVQVLGVLTVACLPMVFYISPTISNELFSAAILSWALYMLMRHCFQDCISLKKAALIGGVFGLAMLSKYTALLLLLVALSVFLIRILMRSGERRREIAALAVFCAMVLAVSGWFYARNAVLFHKPFIANWEDASGFRVEQPPGYRTLGFYFRFGSLFIHTPERSRWSSFWDGYYGSMWMDTHFNMIDFKDQKANSYGSVILVLALLPTAAMCMGFVRSVKGVIVLRRFGPDYALVAAAILMILGAVWHSLRIPTITTLKAFFSLSLMPVFAVFSGFGMEIMRKNLNKYFPAVCAGLAVLFILTGYLFWYRP